VVKLPYLLNVVTYIVVGWEGSLIKVVTPPIAIACVTMFGDYTGRQWSLTKVATAGVAVGLNRYWEVHAPCGPFFMVIRCWFFFSCNFFYQHQTTNCAPAFFFLNPSV
jgi:hypothetical protein